MDDAVAAFRWALAQRRRARRAARQSRGRRRQRRRQPRGGRSVRQAAADGGPAPCAQILLYPPHRPDRVLGHRWSFSATVFSSGRADIDWYHLQYTGSTVAQPDPAQNPLCAKNFSGLAPALIVTAGFDPLRDEGEAYADALRQAGVPVVLKRFDGLLHGFASMATISPACDAAVGEIIAALRTLIAETAAASRVPEPV